MISTERTKVVERGINIRVSSAVFQRAAVLNGAALPPLTLSDKLAKPSDPTIEPPGIVRLTGALNRELTAVAGFQRSGIGDGVVVSIERQRLSGNVGVDRARGIVERQIVVGDVADRAEPEIVLP